MKLQYNIRKSDNKQGKSPAIFMLHGYGSNKEDLFSFVDSIPKRFTVFSLQAPYYMMENSYAWFALSITENSFACDVEKAKESIESIMSFIDKACKDYELDRENIAILGFSQGTMLGLSIVLSYPNLIKRLIGFSGCFAQELMVENYKNNDFSKLKIYLSHGLQDQIIPIEWARQTEKKLTELNVEHQYREFVSAHNISLPNFNSFLEWIENNM